MNDEPTVNDNSDIATDAKTVYWHQRFPAIWQLGILVLLLTGLLAGLVIPALRPESNRLAKEIKTEDPISTTLTVVETIDPPPVVAQSVFVYDVKTNRVLYSKNADETRPLASIAKLMTALVAREVVSDNTAFKVPMAATTQTSASGLAWGEIMTAGTLRDYALLASSNDAAYTLANETGELISEEAGESAFVTAMNVTAEELELPTLEFFNATGLDISETKAGAYGSARDVTFLLNYILQHYPEILTPTTVANERIYNQEGTYHEAENTNLVINSIPNLLGSKTGYTDLASGNLTVAFDAGYNRPVIITVLGSTYEARFTDVVALTKAVQQAFSQSQTE